jgi:dTDP-4-dehydrorhamnose 3,5-epimerase
MTKLPTKIQDAWLLRPKVFRDERGFFLESWNRFTFSEIDLKIDFVQDNHSRSTQNVLRGLHYQIGDAAQGKLVWVTFGAVFDVLVDLRINSPTFGAWDGYVLNAESHERLWIPPGCAHGFLVISEIADLHYKCTQIYDPTKERVLLWDDPDLAIRWPLAGAVKPILSRKDAQGTLFGVSDKYDIL